MDREGSFHRQRAGHFIEAYKLDNKIKRIVGGIARDFSGIAHRKRAMVPKWKPIVEALQ